jgi:hypothetical protein
LVSVAILVCAVPPAAKELKILLPVLKRVITPTGIFHLFQADVHVYVGGKFQNSRPIRDVIKVTPLRVPRGRIIGKVQPQPCYLIGQSLELDRTTAGVTRLIISSSEDPNFDPAQPAIHPEGALF